MMVVFEVLGVVTGPYECQGIIPLGEVTEHHELFLAIPHSCRI
jgi:hypothetical protein